MKMCACGGNSKLIIDEYVINTRNPECRQIVLKNVRYHQCKICGQMDLTKDSQKMVDLLRDHYMKKMYEGKIEDSEKSTEEKSSLRVKEFFKMFHL